MCSARPDERKVMREVSGAKAFEGLCCGAAQFNVVGERFNL
jgi:hypothetical protein